MWKSTKKSHFEWAKRARPHYIVFLDYYSVRTVCKIWGGRDSELVKRGCFFSLKRDFFPDFHTTVNSRNPPIQFSKDLPKTQEKSRQITKVRKWISWWLAKESFKRNNLAVVLWTIFKPKFLFLFVFAVGNLLLWCGNVTQLIWRGDLAGNTFALLAPNGDGASKI